MHTQDQPLRSRLLGLVLKTFASVLISPSDKSHLPVENSNKARGRVIEPVVQLSQINFAHS